MPLNRYFVMIVLLFSFIMVNLYIAVIVQTFAKIRKIRDEEQAEEQAKAEADKERKEEEERIEAENRQLSIVASNPLANLQPLEPEFGSPDMSPPEQIYAFLKSLQLEQYHESVMHLVDNLEDLYLITEEDLIAADWKVIHIRRLKDQLMAPPVYQSAASFQGIQDWDSRRPAAKTPSEEIYAFLLGYKLEQYHPILIQLVDNLDELAELTVGDFERAGLKLLHARNLEQALIDRAVAKPQKGEESLNPELVEKLGGESVGMWRASVQKGSRFWKSWFGSTLLWIWYREDPMVDWSDPPPPAARTKFIEPYVWSGKVGQLIASDAFEGVSSVAIILNIVFMAMDYNKAPDSYRNMINAMEFVFFCVFMIEMLLKFKGMGGLKWYFAVPFNQFDFILVMSSFPSAVAYLVGAEPFINLSMLRVFRLFRMFKLIRSMRQLLEVVASAGKAIGNLIVFIFFFVLIFAIFGMQMFSDKVQDAEGNTPRANFDGTGDALLSLFIVMTGEDWTGIMWNVMRKNEAFGMIFFIIFYIMANYILMEMFCAVILENFQLTTPEKHALQKQLYEVLLAKKAAAKALADSVDKELAEQLRAEMERKEKEEAKERERKIREQNEGSGAPEVGVKPMNPEEEKAAQEKKARREADLKAKIMEEMKQKEGAGPDVPDAGLDYVKEDNDAIDLGELDDGPKVKEKKNALPPSAIVEKTCFYFDQDHPFRGCMYKIEQTKLFEWSVFLAIIMGCVILALDTPYKPNPEVETMILILSPIILAVYNFEFAVKVVSKGFLGKPSAYINDPWNRVDFAVLVMSDISMFFTLIGYATVLPSSIIMAFRTLRVIRPLRLINQNERIQIVFNALFMSLPDILNVMTLLVFCIFMFSILGMGLYMGLFYRCNFEVQDEFECRGITQTADSLGYMVPSVWDNPRYSFDNVFSGMLVLFESSTLEGWIDVMYSCQDINGEPGGDDIPAKQPIENNEVMQALFIVAYICFGVFFVLNLVMGVMIEKFNQISGRGILTDDQKMFKDTILQAKLHDGAQPLSRPPGAVRGWCYSTCTHQNFESGVLFLICVNAALMASEHYDQPNSYTQMLYVINLILTCIFTIEIAIRLIAFFPKQFFADPWNVMDFFIVAVSIIMIPLDGIVNLQALRPFRLLLLFRMIKRAKGIRLMICTLLLSLPALFNVTCLLFLAYFIFAILGMAWWANIRFNEAIFVQAHFRTFSDSLLMLARITTGEGWNSMLRDCFVRPPECTDFYGSTTDGWATDLTNTISDASYKAPNGAEYWLADDCGDPATSVIFYVFFIIVGMFCVINLFVAVILDNYAFMANVGDAEINEFVLDKYKKTWYRYTLADKHDVKNLGQYLKVNKLKQFIGDLGAPLGIVVWDQEGTRKYKLIKEEVRTAQVPGRGIEYRKMQNILCKVRMGTEMMPYEEKIPRLEQLDELKTKRAAMVIQAMYKGKKARRNLGVQTGAAISEADAKAKDFKKRFMNMLANPTAVKPIAPTRPPATPAPAQPAQPAQPTPAVTPQPMEPVPVQTPTPTPAPNAAVGIAMAPVATSPDPALEQEIGQVRNIFRQRADERARAKAAKSGK